MIVEPDFLDHWKTRMLVEVTGEPSAPLAVLRLWAHCQNRKAWTFPGMTADVLKSVCQWPKDAKTFYDAMRKAGFVHVKGKTLSVHDWEKVNAMLISAWENGRKNRGRRATDGIPTGYPPDTRPVSDRTDRSDRQEEIEKTEGNEQTVQTEELPDWFVNPSEQEVERGKASLLSLPVLDCVRFLCSGNKAKPTTRTLEDCAASLPDHEVRRACIEVYDMKLAGQLRRDPGAMLTSLLRGEGGRTE
jgi:hypothetical protein